MSLIACGECDGELSSHAEVCPHCGCPTREDRVIAHYRRKYRFGRRLNIALGTLGLLISPLAVYFDRSRGLTLGLGLMAVGTMGFFVLRIKERYLDGGDEQ